VRTLHLDKTQTSKPRKIVAENLGSTGCNIPKAVTYDRNHAW